MLPIIHVIPCHSRHDACPIDNIQLAFGGCLVQVSTIIKKCSQTKPIPVGQETKAISPSIVIKLGSGSWPLLKKG